MKIVKIFYFILNSNKPTGEKFPVRQMLLNFPNTHTFSCSTNVVASPSPSLLPLPEKETSLVTFKMFIYPCSTFICQKATAVSSINSSFCTAGDQPEVLRGQQANPCPNPNPNPHAGHGLRQIIRFIKLQCQNFKLYSGS